MRLLISGGGTGGHVYPALSVAAAMPSPATNSFLYLGRANSIEERLSQRAQIPFQPIQAARVRGLTPWRAAQNLGRLFQSIGRIRAIMRGFRPTAIFVTGGYVSAPVVWAGAAEKIPSVIYLPDLEPGWAIRATARWATRVAVSFPGVEKHFARGKATTTGYPVRAAFYQIENTRARERFHLDPKLRTLAIFGGSSGAHHMNQVAVENLARLTQLAQVILLTGRNDEPWANEAAARLSIELRARVRVFGYLDEDLPFALAAADLVVARAGAATLGEFPALGLPAILVPYPYAGKHQQQNAEFLSDRGGAVIVPDATLETDLLPAIEKIFNAPEQLKSMSEAMRALAQPRAAENIVAVLQSLERI